MTASEYQKNAEIMIYLTSCAVNGVLPNREKLTSVSLPMLFEVCQSHVLTAVVAYALESVGIQDKAFIQAKAKAIRKNILLDVERAEIFNYMEKEHIWHMPLKGALLKDWYPKAGMRQMSDNDILYDSKFRNQTRKMMAERGFTLKGSSDNVDEYCKKPVYNFELHTALFTEYKKEKIYHYYSEIKNKLEKDTDRQYGYHFRTEDFYLYMITHEYKHYTGGGTGVRSLLDTYIFMKKFGSSLNRDYLDREFRKIGILEFEQQNYRLAMKVFQSGHLTEQEKNLLKYYIFSGTYGSFEHAGKNKVEQKETKKEYIFHRCFPSPEEVKPWFPFFYEHQWLMPVLWAIRPFRGLFFHGKTIKAEIKYLFKHE